MKVTLQKPGRVIPLLGQGTLFRQFPLGLDVKLTSNGLALSNSQFITYFNKQNPISEILTITQATDPPAK